MLNINPPKIIGIVLEKGSYGFISKVIKFLTHSKYSHVEFLLEDEFTVGSREFEGVKIRRLSEFKSPEVYNFIDLCTGNPKPLNDLENEVLWDFISKNLNAPYDYKGIIGYLLNKPNMHLANAWFCSEFIFFGCEKVDRKLSNREKSFYVSPGDIAVSLRLKKE